MEFVRPKPLQSVTTELPLVSGDRLYAVQSPLMKIKSIRSSAAALCVSAFTLIITTSITQAGGLKSRIIFGMESASAVKPAKRSITPVPVTPAKLAPIDPAKLGPIDPAMLGPIDPAKLGPID